MTSCVFTFDVGRKEEEGRAAEMIDEEVKELFVANTLSSGDSDDDDDDEKGEIKKSDDGWHEARHAPLPPSFLASFSSPLLHVPLTALRQTLIFGVILQSFALFLIVLYYTSSSFQSFFDSLPSLSAFYAVLYFAFSFSIAGGLLPSILFLFQSFRSRRSPSFPLSPSLALSLHHLPSPRVEAGFLCIFWFLKGIEFFLLSAFQSLLFGPSTSSSLIPKLLLFLFIYHPLWGTPTVVIAYYFKDEYFNSWKTYRFIQSPQLWNEIIPMHLIAVWIVWLPSAFVVYALPEGLHVTLMSVVVCFWSILLPVIGKVEREEGKGKEEEEDDISSVVWEQEEEVRVVWERWSWPKPAMMEAALSDEAIYKDNHSARIVSPSVGKEEDDARAR